MLKPLPSNTFPILNFECKNFELLKVGSAHPTLATAPHHPMLADRG